MAANLVLGVLALAPLALLWYLLSNTLLPMLGIGTREPTEDDGMVILTGLVLFTAVPLALLWWVANRRLNAGRQGRPWLLASICFCLPSALLTVLIALL